jgi:hypothetical protein
MSSPKKLPVVVIACQVLQDLLTRLLPEGMAQQVTFMDYGLHQTPGRMAGTLQEVLDGLEQPSLVLLGYGLCGTGLKGLKAGLHTLLVPRVDDCIALLLGSYRDYMREFQAVPGTYYLSKGWLESGSHPLKEYQVYVPRYGEKEAMWLMDQQYQHYERLILVAHDRADLETYRPQALEIARFCERWGMRYEEMLGSDGYVRRLAELGEQLSSNGADASVVDKDFLIILPGEKIRQESFMR